MDDELYRLCKKVYKRFPEWNYVGEACFSSSCNHHAYYENGKVQAPKYTSDYLLEKLPLGENINMYFYRTAGGLWLFQWTWRNISGSGDTPLKALLKLTLALHESGELNEQANTPTE